MSSEPTSDQSSDSPIHRIQVLGSGAFGVVHLAYTDGIDKLIAVKSAGNVSDALTLLKEKRIYKAFQGEPEILQFYSDMKTTEKNTPVYNLLLEYAPAGTLTDLIRQTHGRGIRESDVRFYVKMILRGLRCMHAKGYVHCDLKPDNILAFPSEEETGPAYRLKLADFGLAKEPGEEIPSRRFPGTPLYMSPESVKNGIVSPALDIWSLGCTVVQMITAGDSAWPSLEDCDCSMLADRLASWGAKPPVPEFMSEAGKDFLRVCFRRDHTKRWSAQKLLRHPFVTGDSGRTGFPGQFELIAAAQIAVIAAACFRTFMSIYMRGNN